MTTKTLAALFDTASAALQAGRAEDALALLDGIDAKQLSRASAALHATLSQRAWTACGRNRPIERTLTQCEQPAPLPGVALVSACMNREANLLKVLPSWLASAADEIILVDWSSREPLWPQLAHIDDPRLKVLRIEGEPRWILTHAFNVGLRFASRERIYKLDADIELGDQFLDANGIQPGEFIRGFWKSAVDAGVADQKYVNGSFGAFKKDLREAGYYDERILTYGWDDSDLYHRLAHGLGLAGRLLRHGSLTHLPQAEATRLENQAVVRRQFLGRFDPTEFENMVNKFDTLVSGDWSSRRPSQDYALSSQDGRYWEGRRITRHAPSPAAQRELAEMLAIREVSGWAPDALAPLDGSTITGLPLASAWRQARSQQRDGALLAAIQGPAQQPVHVFRCNEPGLSLLAQRSIERLASAGAIAADALVLVEGPAPFPGTAATRCIPIPTALAELLTTRAGVVSHIELERLEIGLQQSGGVHRWELSFEALADSAIRKAQALALALGDRYRAPERPDAHSAIVTSLYDEPNLVRLLEYLACVVLNLRVAERLLIAYEARDGVLARILAALRPRLGLTSQRLILLPAEGRPTFQDLFDHQALLPAGTRLAVANADIALDGTWSRLAPALGEDDFFVLSRRDVTPDGRSTALIRIENGTPNTLSADVWIARTPFAPDFRLDYPIGSYHCDSFINHQASRSARYRLANPCLDVHALHVHDLRFNSSAEKQVRDQAEILRRYEAEMALNEGRDPVNGAPWSSTAQLGAPRVDGGAVGWRPKALRIDLRGAQAHLATLLWLHLLRPQIARDSAQTLVLRLSRDDLDSPLARVLGYYRAHFGLAALLFDIDEPREHLDSGTASGMASGTDAEAAATASVDSAALLDILTTQGGEALHQHLAALLDTSAATRSSGQVRCDLQVDLTPWQTQRLNASLQSLQPEAHAALIGFIHALGRPSKEGQLLWPFLPDLGGDGGGGGDAGGGGGTAAPALVGLGAPKVSLVTSLFRGGTFLEGYLDNAAHSAWLADGEVILVDANCNGVDAPRIEAWFKRRPELRRFFTVIELDQDPGLYACWQLAIERARAPCVGNANLDDRRSPQHTRLLVQALEAHPEVAGTAGSISAVYREATGDWFELLPNEVWFDYLGERSFGFDDLYRRTEDGSICSHNIMHCMPVWRKSLHSRYGFFDEGRYGTSADWAFWLKCAQAGERFWLEPQAYGRYFVNPDSHNRRNDVDGAKERRIIADYFGVQQSTLVKQ